MLTKPLLAAAAALALALSASAPAYALCTVCNSTVRLNDSLASCFANRATAELQKMTADGKEFVIVDLKDCASRGGLPTAVPNSEPIVLDTEFAIDAAGLKCLSDQIDAMDESAMTPSHLFDLTKDCPAN